MSEKDEVTKRVTVKIEKYKQAKEYLENCGELTVDKLVKMNDIAQVGFKREELQQQMDNSALILPSGDRPGGKEAIRWMMLQSLDEGIEKFQEVLKML